ncbi:2-hydroxy-6-oxo-6-(2'-aminophenyl)hexa-2,4-dienoic acid hydrolase [Bacillus sp. THAF10]|uniref:alpha/beta fold hydrolase n=1 Tax=Bacillus sp. THAF10 TaxID=2587848 RepID=UPI001268E6C5|nr:alpha/beta hydrolase [Bacillus sp. THAF10]QFT90388.1 2-hydroxy-6-oxo-6-(2'-aminophenyl)hexa-2,4-dienoic acid hydrolase [Bacillus sp. THAF10]
MISNQYTIKISGINIFYEFHHQPNSPIESKPTLVLIHGFLSSSFSFRRLIPLLTKEYTVLAVDLPPFGKSEKSKSFVYSYENLARVVLELLAKLSIEKTVLIGHSMGGQICLNMSKQKPEVVDKVVLLCSSGYLKRLNRPLIFSSRIPYFYLYLKFWLVRQGPIKNLLNVVYDHNLIDDEMIAGYTEPFYDDQIFHALTRMIRDREGDLASEILKKIETPSLLIWGEEDKVVPVEIGRRLHGDLPNSQLITYKNTGHLLPEEKPEHVHENIMKFLTTS